ncbi:hypothetical protein TAMA11512_09930 [Selenomonas sp. TAMA-11512]|uniref:hypothetical protein n=1 Tax=Selenomonas sp. TAMA-11512 TaxID=3095337 RepID=UPI00308967EA|nr:hypothetical protein TAMA11512_09930 [Selenomonas sp. TAMA-11512]
MMSLVAAIFAAWLMSAASITEAAVPEGNDEGWYWISSDDKYSKYYLPKETKATKSAKVADKDVATVIHAWTKTAYSYGGAQETIENYGLTAVISNPGNLAYSLALLEVHPQNRTIEYVQEIFYNASGKVLWSKEYTTRTVKEINSQSFDEDFYTAIVDQIFRHGETDRRKAQDRWIDLWTLTNASGTESCIADTTTMRLKGDNLIYWEWIEKKDTAGNVRSIQFLKKAVNVEMNTERTITGKLWTPQAGWADAEADRVYSAVPSIPERQAGLNRLKAYVSGYQYWLHRYSLDPSKKDVAKDTQMKVSAQGETVVPKKLRFESTPAPIAGRVTNVAEVKPEQI